MEEIKDKLGEYKYNFLNSLQNYIDDKLIFFGSIKRADYFQNSSDIDIAIITDNSESINKKIINFLNINSNKLRKSIQKLPNTNKIIYGNKINYDDYDNNLFLEIIIYDIQYKSYVLDIIDKTNNLPFYIITILCILKIIYYYFHIISSDTLKYLKKKLMDNYLNQTLDSNLITLKLKN